jgi:peroxiredoxin Q/BCP
MAQLRHDFQIFRQQATIIVVVGPEKANDFKNFWKKERLPFIGLPDPQHSVLKKYGQEVNLFKLGRMPAQVIIDKSGIVRYAHYGHQMSDIPPNKDILGIINVLNQPSYEAQEILSLPKIS